MLRATYNIGDLGGLVPNVVYGLAFAWFLTALGIMFGTKWQGYTAYVTATAPYIILGKVPKNLNKI